MYSVCILLYCLDIVIVFLFVSGLLFTRMIQKVYCDMSKPALMPAIICRDNDYLVSSNTLNTP